MLPEAVMLLNSQAAHNRGNNPGKNIMLLDSSAAKSLFPPLVNKH
jgi:hypothetical protein